MKLPLLRSACISILFSAQAVWGQSVAEQTTELPTAKPEEVGMSSEKLELVQPALQMYVDNHRVPSATVIVARHGKIALFASVGWADIEKKKPMQHDSILRFYSMTKAVTSVSIMMLVEEGKVELDESVATYAPELAGLKVFTGKTDDEVQVEDARREMTVRDLLRHTSGLTYGFFGNTVVDQLYRDAGVLPKAKTLQDMTEKLSELPLLYQPGTQFNYSVSTDVLGHVVERVSGQSLSDFFQQRVFEPLDMRDTAFHVPAEKTDRFIHNYGPKVIGEGLRVIDDSSESKYLEAPAYFSGGGGLVSTARDYIRFCQMLLNKGELNGRRLLASTTVNEMTRNQLPDEAYPVELNGRREGVGFGLGFSVVTERTEWTKSAHVGEYGWGGAASTHFWISPKDDLAVVVLTQHMPFRFLLEDAVKPLVYDAIID